jgi:hypothetical protein
MASAKSLKALAVMEASTVFTSDTFCRGAGVTSSQSITCARRGLKCECMEGNEPMLLPVMIRQL